ncbi:hypothetical protein EYZ11_012610 [Aspergillus tanneri]|uniref:AAA+ ATPase domain-containing protein n=1 Tax=Aspergillus tanneri TaxID=1220188 RepID=A0A4V6RQM4_9EURO|nr:hypothetical protein EYZ11_012610 [Aspergillus tanneri]
MIATRKEVNASTSIPQVVDHARGSKPFPNTVIANLEPIVTDLVKRALSNPATWPGGQPATPVCSLAPCTPPLDTDELEKQLIYAAGTRGQSDPEDSGIFETSVVAEKRNGPNLQSEADMPYIPPPEFVTMTQLKELFEAVLEHKPQSTSDGVEIGPVANDQNRERVRVSRPDFKVILETWNIEASNYKIVESTGIEKELDSLDEYVFVVRNRVDVKSEALRDIFRVVLQNVRAASLMEDKPSIEQNILFHFLPELLDYIQKIKGAEDDNRDPIQLEHLTLFTNYMKEACASTSQRVSSLLQHRKITYDLLWALFKPGGLVYSTCFGTGKPRYLDFDGRDFGEAGVTLGIETFRGAKVIDSLEAFPLDYHPDSKQVRHRLAECGRKFCKLTGTHIQHCDGTAFIMREGKPVQLNISSRVAVDAAFFTQMKPNYSRPRIQDIRQNKSSGINVLDLETLFGGQASEIMQQKGVEVQQMTDDDFAVCSPTVRCFSFREKVFLECAVSDLHEVEWSPESFQCLRIPQSAKKILLSLVTTRLGLIPTVPFDDVIEGKGRGINILLHGPTGVGKTFTVEATAEWFKLPLYSISAGELIVEHGDPRALERQLDVIFKIAKHFNAVLLLDEADAFMERRTSYIDGHNRLLTVFLRKLEYYEGILFLTSNRAIDFDDAILSRIHLKVKYEDLTKESRREIWEHFLSKAYTPKGSSIFEVDDLKRLDSISLNGREIKNLVSIAHSLATVDDECMSYKHVETAAKSNEKFMNDFSKSEHLESMYT